MPLPSAPATLALAPRSLPRYGCMLLQNSYPLRPVSFDIVFFKFQAPSSLVAASSESELDFNGLQTFVNAQLATRQAAPRIGVYLPSRGADSYSTARSLGLGHVSMREALPRLLQGLAANEGLIQDVCVPAVLLRIMLEERPLPSATAPSSLASIPFARLAAKPAVHRTVLSFSQPRLVNSQGDQGYLHFDTDKDARVQFPAADAVDNLPDDAAELQSLLSRANALGFRIWVSITQDLLRNPYYQKDYAARTLALARSVAQHQNTAVLGLGQSPAAAVPDVLPVLPPGEGTEWQLLTNFDRS
jgi:hypothetical protein